MQKPFTEERGRLREELARLEQEVLQSADEQRPEYLATLATIRGELDEVDESHRKGRAAFERARRGVVRSKPSYEAFTVEMPKWRTTILLGLNSAAIAALLSNEHLSPADKHTGGLAFLAGAILAFLSGTALDHVGRAGLALIDELDGVTLETPDEPALSNSTKAADRYGWASALAEWLRVASMACFVFGVLAVI